MKYDCFMSPIGKMLKLLWNKSDFKQMKRRVRFVGWKDKMMNWSCARLGLHPVPPSFPRQKIEN